MATAKIQHTPANLARMKPDSAKISAQQRSMRHIRGLASATAFIIASPAVAQTASPHEMADLIRAQSAEIATLKERIEKLEQRNNAPLSDEAAPPAIANRSTMPAPPLPAASAITVAESAPSTGGATDWSKGAPIFTSADGRFSFKPRGRILADVSTSFGSDYESRNSTSTGIRALRLGVEGSIGTNYFYQMEMDFAGGAADVTTAYIGWKGRFNPNLAYDVRVGQLFNDRSVEGATGSGTTAFLERNVVANNIITQSGFFGVGVMGRIFGDNWHASLSLTGDAIGSGYAFGDSRALSARAHWNPIKADDKLLHIGLWAFDEALSDPLASFTRNASIGGRFNEALRVSSGPVLDAKSTTGYGAELGGYLGPLWVMGEAGRRIGRLNGNRDNFDHDAWTISAGYFFTGERPPISSRTGNFSSPKVISPVFDGGSGAVELTTRYENLDFSAAPLGGKGSAATLGANWHLNDYARLQLNAIFWQTNNRSGNFLGKDSGQTITSRFAVNF